MADTVNRDQDESYLKRVKQLQVRVEELERVLMTCRDAINSLPEDALGDVPDTPDQQGWWIRDELVHNITRILLEKE